MKHRVKDTDTRFLRQFKLLCDLQSEAAMHVGMCLDSIEAAYKKVGTILKEYDLLDLKEKEGKEWDNARLSEMHKVVMKLAEEYKKLDHNTLSNCLSHTDDAYLYSYKLRGEVSDLQE